MESQAVSTSKSLPVVPLGKKRRTKSHRARFTPYPMTDVAENVLLKKFTSTGRTGRRNALPDVLDEKYVRTSVSGLPSQLDQLHLQISGGESSEKPKDTKDNQLTKSGTSTIEKDNPRKDSGGESSEKPKDTNDNQLTKSGTSTIEKDNPRKDSGS